MGDDAELLALKPEFDRLFDEWVRRNLESYAEHREYATHHERVFGFGLEDAPECDWDDPAWVEYEAALKKMVREWHVDDADSDLSEWGQFQEVFFPVADKILSLTATTIEGVKLQTRALISAYDGETWRPVGWRETEPSDPWLRDYVRSVCGVLGIPFPPLPDWRVA
jgi:hypothetical protein